MPDENKREAVGLWKTQCAIIEDDLFGDLYYGNHRPSPAKVLTKAESFYMWFIFKDIGAGLPGWYG